MTALAEALLAAQRQAIGAAAKAFVADAVNESELCELLDSFGASDKVEQGYLLAALHVARQFGTAAPQTTRQDAPPKPMSAAQKARIEKTAKERNYTLPDFENLTMAQASEVIQTMDSGEYDAARWVVPI